MLIYPTCQSTNLKTIAGLSKVSCVAMWGLFSQKVKKRGITPVAIMSDNPPLSKE